MLKPRWSETREIVSLNGLWDFVLDTDAGEEPWRRPLESGLEVAVPASYNDQFSERRIRNHVGRVWYQRSVQVPRGWRDQRVILRFGAATHAAVVYVDDREVVRHVGGYLPFEVDVREWVVPGQSFRLTVEVDNVLTNETIPPGYLEETAAGGRRQVYYHDFFNYAGLIRSVELYSRPPLAIEDIVVTTSWRDDTGFVRAEVIAASQLDLDLTVLDRSGQPVAYGSSGENLAIPGATRWQPGAAYLYQLRVRAWRQGEMVDEYTLPVGIRTVEVRGSDFLINGEPFHFRGFGMHEDSAVRGRGHDDAYLVNDFNLLRWIGANSFRTSHYPYDEEMIDYADRHGIIVIDETPAVGLNLGVVAGMVGVPPRPTWNEEAAGSVTQAAHADSIRELIERDRNHPSVVMWCIANEPASDEEGAREYFEPLIDLTRRLDPSRPVTFTNMVNSYAGRDRVMDLVDVVALNRYYGWYTDVGDLDAAEVRLEEELRLWAAMGKPIIMSEYGADAMTGLHSALAEPWTEEFQVEMIEVFHRVFDRIPEVVGEHVWNFADFQTAAGVRRVDGNRKGAFTRDRRPKMIAHSLRQRWGAR